MAVRGGWRSLSVKNSRYTFCFMNTSAVKFQIYISANKTVTIFSNSSSNIFLAFSFVSLV